MTELIPISESRTARAARLGLFVVLATYVVLVLGVLMLIGVDRVQDALDAPPILTPDDKASLALEQADRILSLLEVVIGAIAMILPLALGILVYIFQQNRRTIEELTLKAERAERNAARSQERAAEYRDEAREIDRRVNEALNQLAVAEQRDHDREVALQRQEAANLQRDLDRDDAARILQSQIADQKGEVVELSITAQELLNRSYNDQHKLTTVDQFLEVRRHSAMCMSDDVVEAITAVITLMQIAQYPTPDDDDDGKRDQNRVDRDMLLRREALRALVTVREAQFVPVEIRERLHEMLSQMSSEADHKVLRLEAKRTLRHLSE